MSATDELRRMLTEAGVEWQKPTDGYWVLLGGMPTTDYATIVGDVTIEEATSGTLVVSNLTPEQAIAATVGRGTCHDIEQDENDFKCSSCGARSFVSTNDCYTTMLADEKTVLRRFNYCPNCGAKVVDE